MIDRCTVSIGPLAAGLLPLPPSLAVQLHLLPRVIEAQGKGLHRCSQAPCCAQGDLPPPAVRPLKRCQSSCSSEQHLCPVESALQLQSLSGAISATAGGCAATLAAPRSSAFASNTLSSYLSPERKSTSSHPVWRSSGCRTSSLSHCCFSPFTFHCSSVPTHSWSSTSDHVTALNVIVFPAGQQASTPQLSPRSRTAIPTNIPKLGGMRPKQTSAVSLQSWTAWHLKCLYKKHVHSATTASTAASTNHGLQPGRMPCPYNLPS